MATHPVFLPGESQGRESLVGCCLWDRTEPDATEVTQQQHLRLKTKKKHLKEHYTLVGQSVSLGVQHSYSETTLEVFQGSTHKQINGARFLRMKLTVLNENQFN